MSEPFLLEAPDLPTAWKTLVPAYESVQYRPLLVQIVRWDPKYASAIRKISAERSRNRVRNYLDPKELERVRSKLETKHEASMRFGVRKEGHGYHGERGDFCLVGAAIDRKNLTLFYRAIELIGGFAYDMVLVDHLSRELDIPWKKITIMATRAYTFAVKRNSNEKLYPKLREIFRD